MKIYSRFRPSHIGVTTLVFIICLSGCNQLFLRQLDEKNVKRQLHIPAAVRMLSLVSNPKTPGFFGREGLRISAVFQFDSRQFEDYIGRLKDKKTWKPVRFLNYSPSIADKYSESSLEWKEIPIPSWPQKYFSHWEHMEEVLKIDQGIYFCSVITSLRGEKVDQKGEEYHYEWQYLGLHCSEIEESSGVVTTFAVIDVETRKLYAIIAFSG
jgi:hypothetical protein